jgi:hypothetical protein
MLTLTLMMVDNNSSRNTSTRFGATNFAVCFKLRRDLSTTREQKTDPLDYAGLLEDKDCTNLGRLTLNLKFPNMDDTLLTPQHLLNF